MTSFILVFVEPSTVIFFENASKVVEYQKIQKIHKRIKIAAFIIRKWCFDKKSHVDMIVLFSKIMSNIVNAKSYKIDYILLFQKNPRQI